MYIKRYVIEWGLLSFIWFAAVFFPIHRVLFGILVLFVILLLLWEIPKKALEIPKLLILALLFQNTIIGVACHLSGEVSDDLQMFTQLPYIIVCLATAIILCNQLKQRRHLLFFLYLVIILIYCYKGKVTSLSVLAYSIRNLTAFYFIYLIGSYFIDSKEKLDEMKQFYIKLATFAGIVGLILFAVGEKGYLMLGIKELYVLKSDGNPNLWVGHLPGNFYGEFFGKFIIRMGSLYMEPVNFSSFMALAVILRASKINTGRDAIQFAFLVVCNILTFGKGGLLIAVLTIGGMLAAWILQKVKGMGNGIMVKMLCCAVIAGGIVLGIIYGTRYSYNFHFYTMAITFRALLRNPMGYGVGTVGNMSDSMSYVGSETGLLNFWCQIGILGLIVFLLIHIRMSTSVWKNWDYNRDNSLQTAFLLLPLVLLIVFVFQENIYTMQVISGYMLFLGHYGNMREKRDKAAG